jgi:hypothetical protein
MAEGGIRKQYAMTDRKKETELLGIIILLFQEAVLRPARVTSDQNILREQEHAK